MSSNTPITTNAIHEGAAPATTAASEQSKERTITTAREKFSKLKERDKKIKEFQSDLDLHMKHFNTRKSLLNKVSDFYGSKPWYIKLLLSALIVASFTLMGAIFHAAVAAICAIVSTLVLLSVQLVLQEDYAVNQSRNARIREDIIELEKRTADSMKLFSKIETQLMEALDKLNLNEEQDKDYQSFKYQIINSLRQLTELRQRLTKLEEAKDIIILTQSYEVLIKTIEDLKSSQEELERTLEHVKTLEKTLEDNINNLTQLSQDLEKNNELIQDALKVESTDEVLEEADRVLSLYNAYKNDGLASERRKCKNRGSMSFFNAPFSAHNPIFNNKQDPKACDPSSKP